MYVYIYIYIYNMILYALFHRWVGGRFRTSDLKHQDSLFK